MFRCQECGADISDEEINDQWANDEEVHCPECEGTDIDLVD